MIPQYVFFCLFECFLDFIFHHNINFVVGVHFPFLNCLPIFCLTCLISPFKVVHSSVVCPHVLWWLWYALAGKMYTIIVAITKVKLVTVQLPTKLVYWRNSSLASPFRTLSLHLYMGEPVVTVCPTGLFWNSSKWSILHEA